MRHNQPQFGKEIAFDEMAEILNLKKEDMDDRFPVRKYQPDCPLQ